MHRLIPSLALLLITGAAALAQNTNFPKQTPLDPEAIEVAGIGSYHLIFRGKAATVEAFAVEGKPLANCEIEWLEDSKSMTCRVPGGDRFRADWYAQSAEFQDLGTGDHFSIELKTPSSAVSSEFGKTAPENRRREPVFKGTKTQEEVERDWGHITPLFGYLMAEVEFTLGITPADRMFAYQRLNPPPEPSLKFIPCPDGTVFCNTSKKCPVSEIASSATSCCSKASSFADTCCRNNTLQTCCANSLCDFICYFGLWCDCFLEGFQFDCRTCD